MRFSNRTASTAFSAREHGNITVTTLYNTVTIDGVLMRDWIGAAMTSPDTLTDAVATGTLEADFPGVQPFPCALE